MQTKVKPSTNWKHYFFLQSHTFNDGSSNTQSILVYHSDGIQIIRTITYDNTIYVATVER